MEITRLGQLPAETEYKGTCRNCSTQFKCKQSEGRVAYDHQRDGGGKYLEVTCPLCLRKAKAYPTKNTGGDLVPMESRYPRMDTSYYQMSSMADQMTNFAGQDTR